MKYILLIAFTIFLTKVSAVNNCQQMSFNCPPNPTWPVYLPNPGDCSSFCKCDCMGMAHYFPCEPGLAFNLKKQSCEKPVSGPCIIDPDPTPTQRGCEKVTSCPVQNSDNPLYLPNPDDCGSYCVCDWGRAIYIECDDGLHFNAESKVCDYPNRSGCK